VIVSNGRAVEVSGKRYDVGILRPTLLPSRCHTVHYQLNDHESSSQKQTRLSFLSTFFWINNQFVDDVTTVTTSIN
jgi:hypothetical protein